MAEVEIPGITSCTNTIKSPPAMLDSGESSPDGDVGNASSLRRPLVEETTSAAVDKMSAKQIKTNFLLMSVFFAINHGASVSCLGLANARLGNVGNWQSGVLYAFYTGSALFGATYAVKKMGARNGLVVGMSMSAVYVGSFFIALSFEDLQTVAAIFGAAVGGTGSSILWTSQGTYFSQASKLYAEKEGILETDVTSLLSGNFAFIFLAFEVLLRLMSTVVIEAMGWSWRLIFGVYFISAVIPAVLMRGLDNFDEVQLKSDDQFENEDARNAGVVEKSACQKATAALDILVHDPRMKYLSFLNIAFGMVTAFGASVVNGQITRLVLLDSNSTFVGFYTATTSAVAAVSSKLFGLLQASHGQLNCGKYVVLTIGMSAYILVAFLFILMPSGKYWNWASLLAVYGLFGIGRATYEGTLRALFADLFPEEKEGAFANVILFTGAASTVGFVLSVSLECDVISRYCLEYEDGSIHDVLAMEILVLTSAVFAVAGLWRAKGLYSEKVVNMEVVIEQVATNEDMVVV